MSAAKDIPVGTKIKGTRLTLVRQRKTRDWWARALFQCDCGTVKDMQYKNVVHGVIFSCGCLRKEADLKRGTHYCSGTLDSTGTYKTWKAIKTRCCNKSNPSYPAYGGRGITMCERWFNSFENFLADMGVRPKGTSIDRYPDNNGNYEPGNCRWATPFQQAGNKRNNIVYTVFGVTDCLGALCRRFNVPYGRTRVRICILGWSVEDAFKEVHTIDPHS